MVAVPGTTIAMLHNRMAIVPAHLAAPPTPAFAHHSLLTPSTPRAVAGRFASESVHSAAAARIGISHVCRSNFGNSRKLARDCSA